MNISYTKQGDYLLPNLILKDKKQFNIGKYGLLRPEYIKKYKLGLYFDLLVNDNLNEYLHNIDTTVMEKVQKLIKELAEKESINEQLKENNQMLWVSKMNNIKNIADMPCNPSIGGSAKGIVVREIDALGGEMGRNADISHLQIKMLNSKKGPGVRSLRCQADKTTYPENMLKTLSSTPNLTIKEALVKEIITENNEIKGIITENNERIYTKKLIITTGTYLNADILRGHNKHKGGPHGEKPSLYLSESLQKNGIKVRRLKTGTPPRVLKSTINYAECSIEKGDDELLTFSNFYAPTYKVEDQIPCYLTYTNLTTHKIILDNLDKCALYSGLIVGIGPRYCPSIEDKMVRFSDKEKHQLFLEPESLYYDDIYIQGFSTSMPKEIQEKMVHSLPGLEKARILRYAYAIEYDAIYPTQVKPSLETKVLNNLFTAGQINGTSGYEEAACQGLIAGINAGLKLEKKDPLILKRNEAYIGVLIDDSN